MWFKTIIYCSFYILLLVGCTPEYYTIDTEKYRVYQEKDLKRNLSDIRALDLSGSPGNIPVEAFQLKELVYLNLNDKGLQSLPDEICSLGSLKVLLLNNNRQIEIPRCLFESKTIETISLVGCELDSIPRAFERMQQLKLFAIVGNYFTDADLAFFKRTLPNSKIVYSID